MTAWPFALMMIFMLFLSQASLADADPSSFLKNRQAIEALEKKNLQEAQEKIISALATNPLDARLHLNLGLILEMLSQPEKAQASYEQALKLADDDQTRFAANYNLGQLAQKARKIDEALKFYQEALRFQPDSKETKINIELLIQESQNQQQEQKDQDGQGQGQEQKDQKDDQNNQKDQKEKPQQQQQDQQQKQDQQEQKQKQGKQRQKFKSEELTPGDAKKILGEIKQQEQKIRAEFNRKESKEQPLEKDW